MALDGGAVLTKFKGDTSDLDNKVDKIKDKLSGMGSSVSKFVGGAFTGIATAYTIAGSAVATMTASAIKHNKELEQSIGGTEAVFGEFAEGVQARAKDSFESMGTSANEYMATMNKLGSILQGSGYSVKDSLTTSAEVMQRASDVASVMGITTEEAMHAITGAAKGNFTMMDNLGVAMNATNLQAYALSKGIDKSYKSMTTAEKSALAYQMFLEKTEKYAGNYAKENKTLAGSFNTLKKSWDNFLSGAGTADDVINSVINAINVLIPKIVELAPTIVQGVVQIIQAIIPQLPMILNGLLPPLIEGAKLLIIGLIEALPDFMNAIAEAIPELMPIIVDAFMIIIPALIENLPAFLGAGMKLIGGIITGMVKSIPVLLSNIGKICIAILKPFANLGIEIIETGKNLLKGLWQGIKNAKEWLLQKIKDLGNAVLDGLKSIFGINSPSKEFAIIGKFSVLGYTEALDDMQGEVQKQINETFGIDSQLANSSALHSSPNVNVVNNISMKQDPLGQMVNDIKTFSGGSKNDYNYGMGVS